MLIPIHSFVVIFEYLVRSTLPVNPVPSPHSPDEAPACDRAPKVGMLAIRTFSPGSLHELKGAVDSCLLLTPSQKRLRSNNFLITRDMIRKSPRDNKDAELLALRNGNQLVASDSEYQRITADLSVIRRDHEFTCNICAPPNGITSALVLKLEPIETISIRYNGVFSGVDALNEWYDTHSRKHALTHTHMNTFTHSLTHSLTHPLPPRYDGRNGYEHRVVGMITVKFDHLYKQQLIAEVYASQPDVKSSEAEDKADIDTDITLENGDSLGTRRYVFSKGSEMKKTILKDNYQDYENEYSFDMTETVCAWWEHRVFDVTVKGEVTHVSTNTTYD